MQFVKYATAILLSLGMSLSYAGNSISIENAWSPEAPPVAPVMAGYATITNNTEKDIYIESVSSPQFAKVEIHNMTHENGVMKMFQIKRPIITAGGKLVLEPGAKHIMLYDSKQRLTSGKTFEITFSLSNGEKITQSFSVKPREEQMMDHDHHHHH